MKKLISFLCLAFALISSASLAQTAVRSVNKSSTGVKSIYISPIGKDSNPGTINKPVGLAKALQLALSYCGKVRLELIFKDGTYYLSSPITLTSGYSGTAKCPVVFRSEHPRKAIISGGQRLQLQWQLYKGKIFVAKVPDSISSIDQLFVNDRRQMMARYPNPVKGKNVYDIWNLGEKDSKIQDCLDSVRVSTWKNPEGGYLHAMHEALWGDMHWLIKGKQTDGRLTLEGGWQNNRPANMHPVYRFVENIFEELDTAGEWYFDTESHNLYYYPSANVFLKKSKIEVVTLTNLINLHGTVSSPVRFVKFQNLVFHHTRRSFMENKEPLLRSDWTIYRGGAMVFDGTEDCEVNNCDFERLGGNSIFVNDFNRRLQISGCYINEGGANGIAFVGNPLAVRSPLFRYGAQKYKAIDRRAGALNNDYPMDCRVSDCLITRTGRYEKQTAPIQISMSRRITISHCSIYNVPRAGINISEGTFGGHIIEYCDVFNTVLETGDHGSFNSWGRDRYWTPNCSQTAKEVSKDPSLPRLDMVEPNTIRNSRWRCDHGWDIDLDDGSSYYHIYNNVLLNGGLKLREGYGRVVYNNIILNNSLHPHVWYTNCGDTVRNNIFFSAYKPIGIEGNKWGDEIDYNFFISQSDKDKYQDKGCDIHSLVEKIAFVNPASGDYRLLPNSIVLKSGFHNIKMDFGVQSPRLKVLALKPVFPVLKYNQDEDETVHQYTWQGLVLKNIETDGEQSAVGIKDKCGLIIIDILSDSPWKSKLQKNDVIIGLNGQNICNFAELSQIQNKKKQSLNIWREQQVIKVVLR